jgi:uncharacterized protein
MSYNHQFLEPFTHPLVRDLSFLIGCAPLAVTEDTAWPAQSWFHELWLDYLPILEKLELVPDALEHWCKQTKPQRLGAYSEHLWHFYLKTSPRFQLITSNLPVRDQGLTLGEFDCLVYDRKHQRTEHWELASKFFMAYEVDGEITWPGPGLKDSLVQKFQHLATKQLRLGNSPIAQQILKAHGIEPAQQTEMPSRALLKGRLFVPVNTQALTVNPLWVNPDALEGNWCTLDELPTVLQQKDLQWLVADRDHWLAGPLPTQAALNTAEQVISHCQSNQMHMKSGALRPNFVIGYQQQSGRMTEQTRLFIIHPSWQQQLSLKKT